MNLLLNVILVIITFFSCYFEDAYLYLLPPQPEKAIPFTVRSQRSFDFDQGKALGGKREMALSQYVPLYSYVPGSVEETKRKMGDLIKKVSSLQKRKLKGGKELASYLQSEFGLEVDQELAATVLRYRNLTNILDGILTIEDSILHEKVVKDAEPLRGKKTIEILYPDPAGIVAHATDETITLEEAGLTLQEKVNHLFSQDDRQVLDALLEISLAALQPNLQYDLKENDRRIEEIVQRYPSKVIHYDPGDILVPFRKVLDEQDVFLLTAYQEGQKRDLYGKAPSILIAIILLVALYCAILSRILVLGWRKKPPYRLLLSSLIVAVLILKAYLLFTPFPIFGAPFAFLPLLIILSSNERVSAAWTAVLGAILVSLFCGRSLEIFLFYVFGGLVAVLLSYHIRKRIHVLSPSLAVGVINVAILSAFAMDWGTAVNFVLGSQKLSFSSISAFFDNSFLTHMAGAFVGGLSAGPLAILLLPMLEVSWQTASNFKLNRYADLQHPLMRDLMSKAPATYQHTMTMAYLSQTVGEAIGAHTVLLRLGAYYHDIGKLANPKFFAENQSGGENPHDDLDSQESARLIINHVKHGEKLGREAGLPEVVVELILQHHGTQLVEYFYNKAVNANRQSKPRMEDFRYPGPKPQSVEAAILMIVDAVEAASRSMEEPTRDKIEKMIRLLIVKRVADGQFDECNLSTQHFSNIIHTLVDSLEASLHSRITYPWQEKKKKR